MNLLPINLGPIATIAAKEAARYGATTGVHLEFGEDQFLAVATDGRRLLQVNGDCVQAFTPITDTDGKITQERVEYPGFAALDSAPNGECKGVVPAKDWAKAFADAGKIVRKSCKPILRSVATVCGKDVTTLGATDGDRVSFHQPRNVDGRFPDWKRVIPTESTRYEINVDPILLAELLETISKLGCDDKARSVTLAFGAPDRPFRIYPTAQGELQTLGVMVPMVHEGKPVAKAYDESAAALENASRTIEELSRTIAELTKERDELQEANDAKEKLDSNRITQAWRRIELQQAALDSIATVVMPMSAAGIAKQVYELTKVF